MKKNVMMRIASILLVCVLATTCAISGTFAKYTTKIENQDAARVARWGFTGENEDIAIGNLFLKAYNSDAVKSDAKVIAPGTTNSATFKFEYTAGTTDAVDKPEVAYTFEVNASQSTCAQSIQDNTSIQWAVLKTSELVNGNVPEDQWGTWQNMIDEINGLDENKDYAAGELPAMSNVEYTIAWRWVFENSNDATDTNMGNVDDLADVTVKIVITATQKN